MFKTQNVSVSIFGRVNVTELQYPAGLQANHQDYIRSAHYNHIAVLDLKWILVFHLDWLRHN